MKSLAPPAREQQEMREKKTRADRPTEARFAPRSAQGSVSPSDATTEQNTLVNSAFTYPGVTAGVDFVAG